MKITIHFFARAKDLAGTATLALEVSDQASVADLRVRLAQALPALAVLLPRSAVAVNSEYADDAVVLSPDDEVALLPPVSGG